MLKISVCELTSWPFACILIDDPRVWRVFLFLLTTEGD